MKKFKPGLIITLTLVVISALLLAGCSPKETTTTAATTPPPSTTTTSPFTEQELKQILLDSKTAMVNAKTYILDINLKTDYSIDNTDSGRNAMSGSITFDIPNNWMKMSFDITNDMGAGGSEENITADLYLLTDYIYMKINIPDIGGQWIKSTVNEEILDSFNANMIQEEMAGMELPASVEFVKYETVKGAECYVIKYIPGEDYLRNYATQQAPEGLEIDWEKVNNIEDIFKDLSYKTWIAKDTKYIMKMEINGTVQYSNDFAEFEGGSFNNAKTTVYGVMEIYDYNTAVSIELPPEAEDAIELSPDMLLGQ